MQTSINKKLLTILCLSTGLSIFLVFFRIQYTSSLCYIFLVWNLVLAWIPLLAALILKEMEYSRVANYVCPLLLLTWFLFFPNAPYILTDLFHLKPKAEIPLWYDLVLILLAAWNGLILGFVSLHIVHRYLDRKLGSFYSWLIVLFALVTSSFGIYLGRFLRWNSWDIVSNPMLLLTDILERILNPFSHPQTVGVTLIFSLFLITCYITLVELIKSQNNDSQFRKTEKK